MRTPPDSLTWRYGRTVFGTAAAVAVLVIGGLTGHVRPANADDVDCAQVKCVALTFDGTGAVAVKSVATKHALRAGIGAGEYVECGA